VSKEHAQSMKSLKKEFLTLVKECPEGVEYKWAFNTSLDILKELFAIIQRKKPKKCLEISWQIVECNEAGIREKVRSETVWSRCLTK
jgi:hypothetical protein